MARGFHTVYGVASTDSIELAYATHGTLRTYAAWTFRTTGDSMRIFDKRVAGAQVELWFVNNSTAAIRYARNWTSGDATWDMPQPAVLEWHHMALTYDAGATTNDPVMYLDGVSQTVTQISADPTGAPTSNADNYVVGNRKSDNARGWGGMMADFAIWDRILTSDEVAALGKSYSALFFPRSLVEYLPMIRDNISLKNAAPTLSGTAVQPHPPIIYPSFIARPSKAPVVPSPLMAQIWM